MPCSSTLNTARGSRECEFKRAPHIDPSNSQCILYLRTVVEHRYRGIVDNFWAISEHLPWLGGLGALTSSGDHAFGITTAADDTTHPPVMQRWFVFMYE